MTYALDLSNWQSSQQLVCLVSKPDSVVIEVQVDRNAIGQDILDKVCESIGTVEKDYFGLQYSTNKIDTLWLNLRNRIVSQVSWQSPLRLRLRVKYFVEPHYLLQEVTRKLFYMQLKQNIFDGKLSLPTEALPKALAAIAQSEIGDQNQHNQHNLFDSYATLYTFNDEGTDFNLEQVMHEHSMLNGTSKNAAVSQFLYLVSALPQYGMEPYSVKLDITTSTADLANYNTSSTDGRNSPSSMLSSRQSLEEIRFCIGPRGIEIVDPTSRERKIIPFRAVQLANSFGKQIDLHVFQDDGSVRTIVLRSSSECQGNALYRIITEMLAFYTWDTVHANVRGQHSLDFKGHFIALFRPKNVPDADKQYIFDIQRTAREVHDNARRVLYKRQQKMKTNMKTSAGRALGPLRINMNVHNMPNANLHNSSHLKSNVLSSEVEVLRERMQMIEEALTCHICCDREIECAFVPCGHQLCCKDCASRCSKCPLCRVPISENLTVFLPVNKELIEGEMGSIGKRRSLNMSDGETDTDSPPTMPTLASPTQLVVGMDSETAARVLLG